MSDLQQGGTGTDAAGTDLSGLAGQPLSVAAQTIAEALAPDNADHDAIRIAIQEAMAEALPEMDVFDPATLSADNIISLLVEFLTRLLFQEITSDAGDAWKKASDPSRTVEAENELMDLIHTTVDRHLSPALQNNLTNLSRTDVEAVMRKATEEIWSEWANHE